MKVGDVVGGHVLLSPLGPRPTGDRKFSTYLAVEQVQMREVALAAPDLQPPPGANADLITAVHRARTVRTPIVPKIFGASVREDGSPLVSCAWQAGIDLRALQGRRGLPPALALPILGRVVAGLEALHEAGLSHRDLHPGNVRITPGGEVFLTGWTPAAIARPNRRFEPEARIPRYAPPEWYREGVARAAGDCYSFGLLLYEVFVGAPLLPAAGVDEHAANQEKLHSALETGRRPHLAIPAEFAMVLRNLLQLDPARRWRSGGEVREAMAALLPDDTPLRNPPRLDAGAIAGAMRSAAKGLLKRAVRHLEQDEPLESAACLRRFSEVLPPGEKELGREAAELLETSLWHTFRRSNASLQAGTERHRQEALALTLYRAANKLKEAELAALAARRLAAYAAPAGPLGALLPPPMDDEERAGRIRFLAKRLRRQPTENLPALELAALTPDFHATDATSLHELRVDVLSRYDLPAAALFHRVQAMTELGADPLLLDSLRPLLEGALRQASEELGIPPPAAPAPEAPRAPAPGGAAPAPAPAPAPGEAAPAASVATPPPEKKNRYTKVVLVPGEPLTPEERTLILAETHGLVDEGAAEVAIENYHAILEADALQPENPDPVLVGKLRDLMWLAVVPPEEVRPPAALLGKLYAVIHAMNPPGLVAVCETIMLDRLTGARRDRFVQDIVARNPWSLPANQAALELAAEAGDSLEEARYRVTVGQELLPLGAANRAQEVLAKAVELAPAMDAAQAALKLAEQALEKAARAQVTYLEIRQRRDDGASLDEVFPALEQLLEWHPNFLPGLGMFAQVAESRGEAAKAAETHRQLADVALAIGDPARAREHLRRAISLAPEGEDALLLFASLCDPVHLDIELPSKSALELRLALLHREKLGQVAVPLMRARLTGAVGDIILYERLVGYAAAAGEDAGPILVDQGKVALRWGHLELARECFEQAMQSGRDPGAVVNQIAALPSIDQVFSRRALGEMRTLFAEG